MCVCPAAFSDAHITGTVVQFCGLLTGIQLDRYHGYIAEQCRIHYIAVCSSLIALALCSTMSVTSVPPHPHICQPEIILAGALQAVTECCRAETMSPGWSNMCTACM